MELLQTPRLLLRKLTHEVYQQVFTSYTGEELKTFFGCRSNEELEEERKKYTDGLSMYRKACLVFQLLEKETNEVIGWCGYHTWYLPHYRAELGYELNDDSKKGKGYMKEALAAILDYGFTTMGLKRVEAFLDLENIPSLRLIQYFGFTQEGTLREHYFTNGRFEDSTVFSLLHKEYQPKLAPLL